MEEQYRILLDRLRTACAKREYCEQDIRRKLSGVPEDAAAEILSSLKADRYIDDSRYAAAYARDKSALSGWGRLKIRYMLASRGIGKECIETALKEIDGGKSLGKLSAAVDAKARALKDDPHRKLKLLRFAIGRGYEYDEVKDIVDSAIRKTEK